MCVVADVGQEHSYGKGAAKAPGWVLAEWPEIAQDEDCRML